MVPVVLAGITAAWLGWLLLKLRSVLPAPAADIDRELADARAPSINDLPDELLQKIFEFAHVHMFASAAACHEGRLFAVCRRWATLIGRMEWPAIEVGSALIRYGPGAPSRMLARLRNAACAIASTRPTAALNVRRTSGARAERLAVSVDFPHGAVIAIESLEALAAQGPTCLKRVAIDIRFADAYNGRDVNNYDAESLAGGLSDFFSLAIQSLANVPVENLELYNHSFGFLHMCDMCKQLPGGVATAVAQLGGSLRSLVLPIVMPLSPDGADLRALVASCQSLASLTIGLSPRAVDQLGVLSSLSRLESLEVFIMKFSFGADGCMRAEDLAEGLEGLAAGPAAVSLRKLNFMGSDSSVLDARGAAALARFTNLEAYSVRSDSDAAVLWALATTPSGLPRLRIRTVALTLMGEDPELLRAAAAFVEAHPTLERLNILSLLRGQAEAAEAEFVRTVQRCLTEFQRRRFSERDAAVCEALAACPKLQLFDIEYPLDGSFSEGLAAFARFCAVRPPPTAGVARTRLSFPVRPEEWHEAKKLGSLLADKGTLQLRTPSGRPHACDRRCTEPGTPAALYHRLAAVYVDVDAKKGAGGRDRPRPSHFVLPSSPSPVLLHASRGWVFAESAKDLKRPFRLLSCAEARSSWAAARLPEGTLRFLQWLADENPPEPAPEGAAAH